MDDFEKVTKQLDDEYNTIKDDPTRLRLFNRKKKLWIDKLKETAKIATESAAKMENSHKKHEPQKSEITKINNLNPVKINIPTPLIKQTYNQSLCKSKCIRFRWRAPDVWCSDYLIIKETPPDKEGVCVFILELASVPVGHIIVRNEKMKNVQLYNLSGNIYKIITVRFIDSGNDIEDGEVIGSRTI